MPHLRQSSEGATLAEKSRIHSNVVLRLPYAPSGNAVASRLSPNQCYTFHGFHPWLSNDTAPQFRPSGRITWQNHETTSFGCSCPPERARHLSCSGMPNRSELVGELNTAERLKKVAGGKRSATTGLRDVHALAPVTYTGPAITIF